MSEATPQQDRWPELRAIEGVATLPFPWPVGSAIRIGLHVSQRRFYRVRPKQGASGGAASLVLVLYAADEAEAVRRYERVARWFGSAGVRVPRIVGASSRALLVEDGGDLLLADCVADARLVDRYEEAARVVGSLQAHGLATPPPNPDLRLDSDRLGAELDFTEAHTLRGWLRADPSPRRSEAFDLLVDAVARLPRRLCHRDFHSRNLLASDTLIVIDFQDAMEGPLFYDLASLLRDDYREVPAPCAARALETFWDGGGVRLRRDDRFPVPQEPVELPPAARQGLVLTAAQRSLKALGTFGYQVHACGRPEFADYARRTWRLARRSLEALACDELVAELSVFDRL